MAPLAASGRGIRWLTSSSRPESESVTILRARYHELIGRQCATKLDDSSSLGAEPAR